MIKIKKNILFLLEACALLRGISYQFTLIGYGNQESYLHWYAYKKLGLSPENVRFLCMTNKEHLAYHYAQSHLFLFSSITETQGLVLAEAMAASTPVIALKGPGQLEIVNDGYNGFLVDTPPEMAEKIMQLSSDACLYKAMQRGAWRTAQRFHLPAVGKELEQWYALVCASPLFSSQ